MGMGVTVNVGVNVNVNVDMTMDVCMDIHLDTYMDICVYPYAKNRRTSTNEYIRKNSGREL
jgi:hypothetical protein